MPFQELWCPIYYKDFPTLAGSNINYDQPVWTPGIILFPFYTFWYFSYMYLLISTQWKTWVNSADLWSSLCSPFLSSYSALQVFANVASHILNSFFLWALWIPPPLTVGSKLFPCMIVRTIIEFTKYVFLPVVITVLCIMLFNVLILLALLICLY